MKEIFLYAEEVEEKVEATSDRENKHFLKLPRKMFLPIPVKNLSGDTAQLSPLSLQMLLPGACQRVRQGRAWDTAPLLVRADTQGDINWHLLLQPTPELLDPDDASRLSAFCSMCC